MRKITGGMLLFPGFQMLYIAVPCDAFAEVDVLSKGEFKYENADHWPDAAAGVVSQRLHDGAGPYDLRSVSLL